MYGTNDEMQLRMAASLIQEAKDQLSPMNDTNPVLWKLTCELENIRISIEDCINHYMK